MQSPAGRPSFLSVPVRAGTMMHINVTPASDDERDPLDQDEEDQRPSSCGSVFESDDNPTEEAGAADGEVERARRKVRRRMPQRSRSASIAVPGLDLQNSVSDSEVIAELHENVSRRRGPGRGGARGPLFARRGSNCSDVDDRSDVEASGGLAASIAAFQALRQRRSSLGGAASPTQEQPSFDLEELVERIKAKETVEFEHDWRMIVTPTSGTIWVNGKTGQFRQYPPNYVVKRQQELLKQGDKDREDLQKEIRHLKDQLSGYEEMKKHKSRLEDDLDNMNSKHDEIQAQVQRENRIHEKIRTDLKEKADKCIMYEKEMDGYLQRIQTLTEKANESFSLEEKIEELTETLNRVEMESREKDFMVSQSDKKRDEALKKLEDASGLIAELQFKNEETRYQVRAEVERNTRIEAGLLEMDELRESTKKARADLAAAQVDLDDKTKLLTAARRSIREYRDRIRALEKMESEYQGLQEDLKTCQYENLTLKKLLAGKDSLVLQKTQALDLARHVMEQLKAKDERIATELDQVLARTQFVASQPPNNNKDVIVEIRSLTPSVDLNGSVSCNGADSDLRSHSSSSTFTASSQKGSRRAASNARSLLGVNSRPFSRSESNLSQSGQPPAPSSGAPPPNGRASVLSRSSSSISSSSRVPRALPQTAVVRPQPKFHSPPRWGEPPETRPVTKEERVAQLCKRCGMKRQDADRLSSLFIHMGDHVKVPGDNDGEQIHGVVKYVGPLETHPREKRVFVGLKVEEGGDNDGCHKGVRYFSVPFSKGKFVRASLVQSVLSLKLQKFKPLEESLTEYLSHVKN